MPTGHVANLAFSRQMRILCLSLLLTGWLGSSPQAAVREFVGEQLSSPLRLRTAIIIGSDSLLLNGRVLIRGEDYRLRATVGEINLHQPILSSDTLLIYYTPVPLWLQESFGRPVPAAVGSGRAAKPRTISSSERDQSYASDISISGAKSFRISSQTSGSADFSQTLDLKISGELSEGLFISGHVTDRDIDRTYGSLNSRLSELDLMNIRVYSSKFEAELGDLTPGKTRGLGRNQQMTGLGFQLKQRYWAVNATIARPKGEFESVSLDGLDGLQGPYQVSRLGRSTPVVPASETVWLDGQLLERGTDKDYEIDYSLGRITFNVNYPIDSRSRIEIDYEPQGSAYKKELYSTGMSAFTSDSTAFLGFQIIREGDDSSQPLSGELTDAEKALLSISGDSAVWTSSVIADSSGNYLLIVDSLPDSVYMWVESNGAYSISFGYVGRGKGDYKLIGNGVYEYAGLSEGDYLPVKELSAPKRTSYYQLNAGVSSNVTGVFDINWQISAYDNNLLSSLNDRDNNRLMVELSNRKSWSRGGRTESLNLSYRHRQPEYKSRERIYIADFDRKFYLPEEFIGTTTERLTESEVLLQPFSNVRLEAGYARLSYQDQFHSDLGSLKLTTEWFDRLTTSFDWQGLKSTLVSSVSSDTSGTKRDGELSVWRGEVRYRPGSDWLLKGNLEKDRRRHEYKSERQGTRYTQIRIEAGQAFETIGYEHYLEDSLMTNWTKLLTRDRLSLRSNRKLNNLNYNLSLTHQWLKAPTDSRENFLGRLNLRYDDQAKRLTSSASYLISNEVKNARGITYFEVAPGDGDYILDESALGGAQYIPDDRGNYIRLEEVLSQASEIQRGERSFLFSKGGSGWQIRFDSRHIEELLAPGKRSWWWGVPFLVDESEEYLFFSGRHNIDFRGIDLGGFYFINLSGTRQVESRLIGGSSPTKETLNLELALKERAGSVYLEESIKLFRTDRDSYYFGIGVVDGYRARVGLKKQFGEGEAGISAGQRVARSDQDEKVVTYLIDLNGRQSLFKRGKLRTELELYSHKFSNVTGPASYQLTDNRSGKQGAVWSVSLQYGLKKELRANLTLSGRHSDDRSGRVLARGELIATF